MRRFALTLAVLGLMAAVPANASAAGFSLGVAAADVSTSSAILWAHATSSGRTTLEVAGSGSFGRPGKTKIVAASKSHDYTVQTKITGLRPNTKYFYRWRQGTKTSKVGTFKTAPAATSDAPVKFSWTGDADAQAPKGSRKPFYNTFQVYRRQQRERNAFNINMGDTIYSDTEVGTRNAQGVFTPAAPTAKTVAAKWAKYRQNLALANLANLRGSGVMYNHWDDHEFINDFTKAENGSAIYKAGVKAFRDYMPVTYSSSKGIYRSFRWGKNLEVFMLDERSFRSAKASANHQCDDRNGNPDLGPTAPQSARSTFAAIYPALSDPPKAGCVEKINDPSRTMLGSSQFTRFTNAVKSSTATFKVIMNEVPIQQFYSLPYDRWEGYEAERKRLMDFLATNAVKNVVFLTTDVHANLVNTIKFSTLGESGPPVDTGIFDLSTGPVATMTYHKEIATALGSTGAADLFRAVVLHGGPPTGVAMKCAADDVFSYGQVSVTGSALTIQLKDINGAPVKEDTSIGGAQCGPYVFPKQ
jgi:phosphodiesterase/alkaline phosphatase D-like protein